MQTLEDKCSFEGGEVSDTLFFSLALCFIVYVNYLFDSYCHCVTKLAYMTSRGERQGYDITKLL